MGSATDAATTDSRQRDAHHQLTLEELIGVLPAHKCSAVSSFVVDAIVGLAQPLTEALDQFAGGRR